MSKNFVRGTMIRVKHRHGIHHTQVEEKSSKKHLRNDEVSRQAKYELDEYLASENFLDYNDNSTQ